MNVMINSNINFKTLTIDEIKNYRVNITLNGMNNAEIVEAYRIAKLWNKIHGKLRDMIYPVAILYENGWVFEIRLNNALIDAIDIRDLVSLVQY